MRVGVRWRGDWWAWLLVLAVMAGIALGLLGGVVQEADRQAEIREAK